MSSAAKGRNPRPSRIASSRKSRRTRSIQKPQRGAIPGMSDAAFDRSVQRLLVRAERVLRGRQ